MITLEDRCGDPVRIISVKPDGSFDVDLSIYQLPEYKSRLVKRDLRTNIESDVNIDGLSMVFDISIELDDRIFLVDKVFLVQGNRQCLYTKPPKKTEFIDEPIDES